MLAVMVLTFVASFCLAPDSNLFAGNSGKIENIQLCYYRDRDRGRGSCYAVARGVKGYNGWAEGWSRNCRGPREAEGRALEECRRRGGRDCQIIQSNCSSGRY